MGFDIAPYGQAIASVSDLLNGVLKRVLPEKMSEADAAALQTQITMELMKQDWGSIEKEYQDRADARALAKADVDKGNWWTNVLSATVRPVFGYVCMAAFILPLALRISGVIIGHPAPDIVMNDVEKEVVLSVIYFFFGGRTVEKGLAIWKGNGNGKTSG